jgi:6-hydroxytryprostatin B O-methyltransferase
MGGGMGHICKTIARHFPKPRFLVQDLASVIAQGKASLESGEESIKNRISFMEHNFWQPQTVEADVYLLRLILHDWSDEGCARLLKNIIPKMGSNSKIVIVDSVLHAANIAPKAVEKLLRCVFRLCVTRVDKRTADNPRTGPWI